MNTGNIQAGNAAQGAAQLGCLINFDQYAEYMEQSEPVSRMDLGSSMISKVQHPVMGVILLVSTDAGGTALIKLN